MAKIKFLIVFTLLISVCCPAFASSVWVEGFTEEETAVISPALTTYAGDDTAEPVAYSLTSTVYDDGFISSTYLDMAKGLISRVPFGKDYVFARTGQYQYIFAIGDFESGFSDSQADIYQLDLANNWNDSYYSYMNYVDSFTLSTNGGMVYSNLAPYPDLKGSDFSYEILFGISFAFCLLGIWSIIRHIPTFIR